MMKRNLMIWIVALLPGCAYAHDSWTGPDKKLHAEYGLVIGGVTAMGAGNGWLGFGVACAAGGAKELYDMAHQDRHTASWRDFVVTCAAGGLGALGGHWALTQLERPRVLNEPQDRKVYLVYVRQFD